MGREQCRDEISGSVVAAYFRRLHTIHLRRADSARAVPLDGLVRIADPFIQGIEVAALVARRTQSRGLHHYVQFGAHDDFGFACRALSGRVARLGFVVGRQTGEKLEKFAALLCRSAGFLWRPDLVLARAQNGIKRLAR